MKFLLLLAFFSSCNYKIEKNKSQISFTPQQEMMDSISYHQVREEVFLPKCISCHGNEGGVNLESYSSAFNHLDEIRRTTLQTKSMPKSPVGHLSDRQLEVITAWVDSGGPDAPRGHHDDRQIPPPVGLPERPNHTNHTTPQPGPNPVPPAGQTPTRPGSKVVFETIKKVILENKCLSCHKPGEHAGHIPLSTRSDLLNSPLDLVIPGKPDESGLMIVVSPGARKQMPPMDSGIAPLTKNQRDLIRTWILNGAL